MSLGIAYSYSYLHAGGEDYISVKKMIRFFAGGERTRCVHIPILNDECLEYEEAFAVELSTTMDCVTIGNNLTAVFIEDDDGKFNLLYSP